MAKKTYRFPAREQQSLDAERYYGRSAAQGLPNPFRGPSRGLDHGPTARLSVPEGYRPRVPQEPLGNFVRPPQGYAPPEQNPFELDGIRLAGSDPRLGSAEDPMGVYPYQGRERDAVAQARKRMAERILTNMISMHELDER